MDQNTNERIDTSTNENWAASWVKKVRQNIPIYKAEFSEHDLLCDAIIGDLPWNDRLSVVIELIPNQPGFAEMIKEFKDAFNSDALADNFEGKNG